VNWSNLLSRVALQRGDPPTHLASIRLDDLPLSIGDSSFVRWEHFGSAMSECSNAEGWAVGANGRLYCTGAQTIEPLRRLVSGVVENEWSCDIRQVVGVTESKSSLERFGSLDELAIHASPELSADVSPENLRANLAHHGIRIGQPHSTDCFRRRLWDRGRVFLCNGDGSHHFAAARYIAGQLGQSVLLNGPLWTYRIEIAVLRELLSQFELFAIAITELGEFSDWMERRRAPFFEVRLPRTYEHAQAVLLPCSNARASRAARELNGAGVTNLGLHLEALAISQP
jgi:hypothetical protein